MTTNHHNNQAISPDLTELREQIDKLTIEDKVKLVEDILKGSGLQVVMGGGNFFSADVVLQIHTGSAEQLSEIFRALADRVGKEPKR